MYTASYLFLSYSNFHLIRGYFIFYPIRKKPFLLLLLLSIPLISFSQERSVTDSVDFAFLPALSFNSDFGFIIGGITNRYHYREEVNPFFSYLSVSAIVSTKGLASFQILSDKPNAFGKNIRILNELYLSRFFEDSFFGVANYTKVTDTPPDLPDYYSFKSFSFGFKNTIRFPIYKSESFKQLDANTIIDLDYETPWDNAEDRLITLNRPLGIDGGRTFMIGGGIIWEARDNEFRPSSGNYLNTSFEAGNKLWGSSFNNSVFKLDARQYLSFFLLKHVTFASRIQFSHTNGQTPYWKLSYVGDEETLRGFEARRFLDDNAVVLNTELRTWLLDVESIKAQFGGTLFFDTGRTFPNGMSFDRVTSDLKYSFGFGGLASFFTPDFIIRGDFGFSEEGVGVYFSTGFMF